MTVKKPRIWSLDLARGFALVYVVVIHILEYLSSVVVQQSPPAYWTYVSGRLLGSVIFMFLMGVSVALSTRGAFGATVRRGVEIVAIGYALNFFRGTLPTWLALHWEHLSPDDVRPGEALGMLKEFDILPFAGVALIVLAVLKRFLTRPLSWALAGGAILALTLVSAGFQTGHPVLDLCVNPIFGGVATVHFPLLPWLFYPILGMVYGHYLARAPDVEAFSLRAGLLGVVAVALLFPFIFEVPKFASVNLHELLYLFRASAPGAIWHSAVACVWLAVCFLVVKHVPENPVFRELYFWSRNVTRFYVIQWLITGWTSVWHSDLAAGPTLALVVAYTAATALATRIANRLTGREAA